MALRLPCPFPGNAASTDFLASRNDMHRALARGEDVASAIAGETSNLVPACDRPAIPRCVYPDVH